VVPLKINDGVKTFQMALSDVTSTHMTVSVALRNMSTHAVSVYSSGVDTNCNGLQACVHCTRSVCSYSHPAQETDPIILAPRAIGWYPYKIFGQLLICEG